jgi:hypothetical protein
MNPPTYNYTVYNLNGVKSGGWLQGHPVLAADADAAIRLSANRLGIKPGVKTRVATVVREGTFERIKLWDVTLPEPAASQIVGVDE